MSNALAIAAVTAILKDLLNNGLIDHNINNVVPGDVTVTSLPPSRIDASGTQPTSQLNIFLYNVTPNLGWRNVGLPSRDARGDAIDNPPLALDLHYVLMAYGAQELDAEILLGYGMQLLHENPVLARAAIRRSLAPPTVVGGSSGIPDPLRQLSTSQLAEQIEQIKIAPFTLTNEELSKIWTAFQASFRPMAAYQVTVVLIESTNSVRTPLPVLTRNIYVNPFQQPILKSVLSQVSDGAPITTTDPILVGQNIVLRGNDLRGEITVIRFGADTEVIPEDAKTTADQIIVRVPDTLQAGVQSVQIVHLLPIGFNNLPHAGPESSALPFVLRPRLDSALYGIVAGVPSVTVHVAPLVAASQRARLLLNELAPSVSIPGGDPPAAYSIILPDRDVLQSVPTTTPPPTDTLVFPIPSVKAATTYLTRAQVDGADSPLEVSGGVYSGPTVGVP